MPWWLLIGIIVFAALFPALIAILIRGGRRSLFQDRDELPLGQIYAEYYRDSGIPITVLEDTLTRVASIIEAPAGQLRPTDRFDHELGPVVDQVFDDVLAELWDEFSEELKARSLSFKKEIQTLDDLVRAVWDFRRPNYCRHCGYPLKGLPQPRCPECGSSFAITESKNGASVGNI